MVAEFFQGGLTPPKLWLILGFLAQAVFASRFIVQWIASERAKASVMPIAFWYLSLCGAVMLLAYAIHRRDPVFILGQGSGAFVYLRNLYLIRRGQGPARTALGSAGRPER